MGFYEERQKRTESFQQDRFGMFIHWGLYAIPARSEWVRNQEKISTQSIITQRSGRRWRKRPE